MSKEEKSCHPDCDNCHIGHSCCGYHCDECGKNLRTGYPDGYIGVGCSHEDSRFYQCPDCKTIKIR